MAAEKAPAGPQMDNVDSFLHMEPWSAEEVSAGAKTHEIDKFWMPFSMNEPTQRFLGAQKVA